jgi:Tfp pilus assembly protein PilO
MKKPSVRHSWLITLPIASVAGAYLYFFFFPGQLAIAELRHELQNKQAYAANRITVLTQIAKLEQEIKDTQAYNEDFAPRPCRSAELAKLFGQIAERTQQAGVVTTRFAPESPVKYDALRRIPLRLGCEGSFGAVCKLLESLESLDERLWIDDLNLSSAGKDGKNVSCEISLVVFADNSENSD